MTRRRPEQQLQKAVLEHLAWRGVRGIEAAIFKSLDVIAGVPDLLIVHQGQLYALEFKTAHGRLTATQAETQERLRAAGTIVATTVEIDTALERLEQWGLLRPNVSNQLATAFSELRRDVAEHRKESTSWE